jgi:GAF domain-containing protein
MIATDASGAGIMLMGAGHPTVLLAATNAVSSLIEELQFTLGEGPCVDAYTGTSPITEPDLAGTAGRWPFFTHSAIEAGVRAIYGFPISVGSVCIGALSLYRDRPGSLTDDQRSSALAIAALAGRRIVALQA